MDLTLLNWFKNLMQVDWLQYNQTRQANATKTARLSKFAVKLSQCHDKEGSP